MSEDPKPVVPAEEQSVEIGQDAAQAVVEDILKENETENAQEAQESAEAPEEKQDEKVDFSGKGLKELVDDFKSLLDGEDMQKLYKHAEAIKAAFYKNLRKEKIASGIDQTAPQPEQPAAEAGAPAEAEAAEAEAAEAQADEEPVSVNPFAEIERGFKNLYGQYKTKKAAFVQDLEKKKEDNYRDKMEIIEELKALVEKQDDLSQAFPLFREIQNRWRATGPVPQAKMKDTYDTYQHYVEMFYDYVKINKELRDLDFKKNLEAKEELCRKAEALDSEENPVEAFRTLQKLHEQWKELGPVSKDKRNEIWDRFKAATAVINKKHQAYFESQKGNQKENFEAKTALCEKVEALAKQEVKDSNTWNELSKQIEEIQKEWKKIGFASKKDNQKVYDRFRAACDEFFAKKRDFYTGFKDQMQENLEKKIALCEKAEAIKDSTEWKKTADELVELQKQWREIGPVSRKKSEQIWKRFRAACDEFFNNRDKQMKDKDSQFNDNLSKKLSLIDEIKSFVDDGNKDVKEALRDFQERWNAIGFVPFRDKTRVQDSFRSAISEKFGDLREAGGRAYGKAEKAVRTERDRLVQKFLKKEQDIQTWENNMGFFSKSKNAEALLEELNKKIDVAKQELAELEQKIKDFDKQFDQE